MFRTEILAPLLKVPFLSLTHVRKRCPDGTFKALINKKEAPFIVFFSVKNSRNFGPSHFQQNLIIGPILYRLYRF